MAVVQRWAEAYSAHVVAANPGEKTINRSRLRLLDVDVSPAETGLSRVVEVHFQSLGTEDRSVENGTERCRRLS